MYEKTFPNKRFKKTLLFLEKHIQKTEQGFNVKNTHGEDLDTNLQNIENQNYTVITAFEIFEHLLNPFTVLQSIKANKLVISIPLRLWFSSAYQSKTDQWDRHYHEFEDWQLDWLLEKTGWKIIDSEKFTNPTKKIGIRPLLRYFTNRYYIVYAERK